MSRAVSSLHVEIVAGTRRLELGVDEARKILGTFVGDTRRAARATEQATARASRAIGSVGRALTSVRTILAGALAAFGVAGALAAFGVARFVRGMDQAASAVAGVAKAAKRMDLDLATASGLRFFAEGANVGLDQMSNLVGRLSKSTSEAARTLRGPAYRAFRELRVEIRGTDGELRSVAEILPDVSRRLAALANHGDRRRLAEALFGRGGGDNFLRILQETGDGLENLDMQMERARRLGVIFTPEQARNMARYRDAIRYVGEAWLGFKVKVMDDIAPYVTEWGERLASFSASLPEIINRGVQLVNAAIDKNLSQEQRDRFARIYTNLNHLVSGGIKGIFRVAGGGIVDGLKFLVRFTPGLVTSALNAIFLQPLYAVTSDAVGQVKAIYDGIATMIEMRASVRVVDRVEEMNRLLAELEDLEREYASVQENLDNNPYLDGQDRFREETRFNGLAGAISSTTKRIAELKQEIATGTELTPIEAAFKRAAEATASGLGGLKAVVDLGSAAIQKWNDDYATEELGRALDATFNDRSMALRQLREAVAELGPEAASVLEQIDGLLLISEAMERNSIATKDLQVQTKLWADELPAARDKWGEFTDGVTVGLRELSERYEDFGDLGRRAVDNVVEGLSTQLADALLESGDDFDNFGQRVLEVIGDVGKALARMVLQFALARAVTGIFSAVDAYFASAGGNAVAGNGIGGSLPNFGGSGPVYAKDGAIGTPHRVIKMATGGVMKGETWFDRGNNTSVVAGENPTNPYEAWMPLEMVNGRLGVAAAGSVVVQVYDQRKAGERVEVQSERGSNGDQIVRLFIRDEVGKMVAEGGLDRYMAESFGVNRRGVRRS